MYTLKDLFNEYVNRRLNRMDANQALQVLVQLRPDLPVAERQMLTQRIQEWEAEQKRASQTIRRPNQQVSEITCKNCGVQNPPGSKYCYSCGWLVTEDRDRNARTQRLEEDDIGDTTLFQPNDRLVIWVRGFNDPLHVQVNKPTMVIGRSDPTVTTRPDIDFAEFNAKDLGVSRRHATLQWQDNTLSLIDAGSVNHSFVNGNKLHAHEVRVIRDGDEIRFGQMVTRFLFHR